MLDIKFVREHPDVVRAAAKTKRMDVDVDRVLDVDRRRRELVAKLDADRAEQNRLNKSIGALPTAERAGAAEAVKSLKSRLKEGEEGERALTAELRELMLRLPNPLAAEVPDGASDKENVEVRRVGAPRTFDFVPLDYVAFGAKLGIFDAERAGRIVGARQYLLLGDGCRFEHALLRFAMDLMQAQGFMPV